MEESGELSGKISVLFSGTGIPEHDSSIGSRIGSRYGGRYDLESRGGDVTLSSGTLRSWGTNKDLNVGVGRGSGPVGPYVEVKSTWIVIDSTIIVVELNPNIIEPSITKGGSNSRSHHGVRIDTLGSTGDVIGSSRLSSKVSSKLRNESSIAYRSSTFDVKIDSVKNSGSKGSNRASSSKEHIPDGGSEGCGWRIRAETVGTDGSTEGENNLLSE